MVPFTVEEFWGVDLFSEGNGFDVFEMLLLFNAISLLALLKIVTGADVWPYVPVAAAAFGVFWALLHSWLTRSYRHYRPRVDFALEPPAQQSRRRRGVGMYMAATFILLFVSVWFASY
jgi:hypothetical protein